MNARILLLATSLLLPLPLAAQQHPVATMPSFASDSALYRYLRRLMARRDGLERRAQNQAADAAAPSAGAASGAITNVQHAGVDEGDIVKLHGDHLVILRRGRLFTVAVGGHTLRAAGMSDAFGPGIDPGGTWYDEMLISGDKVVVIGYSYSRGGTEAGIFRLGNDGSLQYLATFQLRSNDYYSSRNYAARLIGTRLVFYAPLYLPMGGDLEGAFPAFRRWNRQQGTEGFVPIVRGARTFRPAGWEGSDNVALHTVTSCDLAAAEVNCQATVVLGPPGNVFYVSATAVYVWMSDWTAGSTRRSSMLARLPLDGGRPTAQKVNGSPVDQFSFMESDDGYINVVTLAGANGDQMWDGEQTGGPVSLLRFPLDSLGDGSKSAAPWWYRRLPSVRGGTFQNRFTSDYVLYGTGSGWGGEEASSRTIVAVPWRGGDLATIRLAHGTDRIEVMGPDAVVIGVREANLEFTGIRLSGRPRVVQRYSLANASQGELRSHGFFYRMDGPGGGMIGLPVREASRPGWVHLVEGSASVLFLRNTGGRFVVAGRLSAGEVRNASDGCRASCVDWYGNARPIFTGGRTFALMGYELIEGELRDGRMRELRRVNFSPVRPLAARGQ